MLQCVRSRRWEGALEVRIWDSRPRGTSIIRIIFHRLRRFWWNRTWFVFWGEDCPWWAVFSRRELFTWCWASDGCESFWDYITINPIGNPKINTLTKSKIKNIKIGPSLPHTSPPHTLGTPSREIQGLFAGFQQKSNRKFKIGIWHHRLKYSFGQIATQLYVKLGISHPIKRLWVFVLERRGVGKLLIFWQIQLNKVPQL